LSDKNRTELSHRTRTPTRRVPPHLSFQRPQFMAGDLKVPQQSAFVWSTIGPRVHPRPTRQLVISLRLARVTIDGCRRCRRWRKWTSTD